MQNAIIKTEEVYYVVDFCLFLVPAANLNRPTRTMVTSCKT